MNSKRIRTLFFALISMIFWGLSFIGSKIAFKYYDPITTIILRLVISSIVLFIILKIFFPKELKNIKKDFGFFVLLAFFEPFLYFIGESFGLLKVEATFASVIICTIPLFTAIVGVFVFKEKLTLINFVGIFISFCGVVVMTLNKNMQFSSPLDGILLIFLAVFAAVGYGIVMKKMSYKYHPIYLIAVQSVIGFFLFLPLFIIFSFDKFITITPNFELIAAILFLAIFASSLAFILYIYVVRHLGIARANIFTNIIPIVTAIASFFVLKEEITNIKMIGIVIVIGGVYLSQRHIKFKKKNKKS